MMDVQEVKATLRSYIEAMGGQLDVIARFPEGSVRINTFSDLSLFPTDANEKDR